MIKKIVTLNTEFIKLDSLLKMIGEASTGGQAKIMIQKGEVYVNNTVCLQRGKKIRIGDFVRIADNEYKVEASDL